MSVRRPYLVQQDIPKKPKGGSPFPLLDPSQVRDVCDEFFPGIWPYLEACLAAMAVQKIDDAINPSSVILVGPPSGLKTTVLDFSKGHPWTYGSDKFTPKSFVSQASNRTETQLRQIDLLPRIKDKILIVPELAPTFTSRSEELQESMGTLTRVFDGQGLTLDAGSHGRRGYFGPHMFTLLAATTPLANSVWRIMGKLGNRLFFLQMSDLVNDLDSSFLTDPLSYKDKLEVVHKENLKFLDSLYSLPKQTWKRSSDPKTLVDKIVKIAKFGCALRGVINSVGLKNGRYDKGATSIEQPYRYSTQLYNLARGRALVNGRVQIDVSDLWLVREIVLSSTFELRSNMIRYLLTQKGVALKTDVVKNMGCSTSVAYEVIDDLVYLKVVEEDASTSNVFIKLPNEYYKCLSFP